MIRCFSQLVFNACAGGSSIGNHITWSSLDRWVDLRFNSLRWQPVLRSGSPSSCWVSPNTWWNRICRCSCHFLYWCSSLAILVVACKSHHRRSCKLQRLQLHQSVAGTGSTVLFTVHTMNLLYNIEGVPLKKETQNSTVAHLGLPMDLSLPLFPSTMIITKYGENMLILMKLLPSYG